MELAGFLSKSPVLFYFSLDLTIYYFRLYEIFLVVVVYFTLLV